VVWCAARAREVVVAKDGASRFRRLGEDGSVGGGG
jgi:hypothetical protein